MSDTGQPDFNLDLNLGEPGASETEPPASPDDLASPFLKNVREGDRPIVQQYIKDWDRGVQQRFQAIHDQYKPYKELGAEPEDIDRALRLAELINEDPKFVYDHLANIVGQSQPQQQPGQFENPWADEGVPDALAQRFMQQEQILTVLAERMLGQENTSQEQQEAAELDSYMQQLSAKYGDFNEDFVLTQLAKGLDGDAAVQLWNETVQGAINSRRSQKPPPAVLGGNGSVPQGGVDPRKLSREETVDYVTKNLLAIQQER